MSAPAPRSRRYTRYPAVWWSRMKVRWPLLIWLGAIWLVWHLHTSSMPASDFFGVVTVPAEHVAPLETARLLSVPVTVGQRVRPGQVLARFDATSLEWGLAAERMRLERQFVQLVQEADTAVREARLEQARDEAELAALTAELERLGDLRERNLADVQELARVRVPREALARAVELYPDYIAGLEAQLAEAVSLQEQAGIWLESSAGTTGGQGVEDGSPVSVPPQFALRSTHHGVVGEVRFTPGDVVPAGETVIAVIRDTPATVTGYIIEERDVDLSRGQRVYIRAAQKKPPTVIPGTVASVSPHIAPLPVQFSRLPTQIIRGRQAIIVPSDPLPFPVGTSVTIALAPPEKDLLGLLTSWLPSLRPFLRQAANAS